MTYDACPSIYCEVQIVWQFFIEMLKQAFSYRLQNKTFPFSLQSKLDSEQI